MDKQYFTTRFINSMVLVWLCCCSLVELSLASNATYPVYCTATERRALVSFKQSLSDPSARLSSWVGENCCQWQGITCDFISGKVTKIDLRNSLAFTIFYSDDYDQYSWEDFQQLYKRTFLGGNISSSLLKLKRLHYLDLSGNNFEGATIPYFFGKFKSLRYLNLSSAHFGGVIPFHLGNLSSLHYLDLHAYNSLIDGKGSMGDQLHGGNLQWLSGLSSLKYLDIGQVNLSSVQANWAYAVIRLSSLLELHLSNCEISSFDSSISFQNFTSLRVLDLSFNSINSSFLWLSNLTSLTTLDISANIFQGAIPQNFVQLKNLQYLDISSTIRGKAENHIPSFLRNLCQLRYLNLRGNKFGGKLDEFLGSSSLNYSWNKLETLYLGGNRLVGEIPNSLGIFENLQYLDLFGNELWGSLPNLIGNLSSLKELEVSSNLLNGTIPSSFGQLSELFEFHSFGNSWKSVITEAQFVNLTKLEIFEIFTPKGNDQHLVFNVPYDWIPPFRLKELGLVNCLVGPQFPVWLQVQTQLTDVTLSNVGISDFVPNGWIPKLSAHIVSLDLSNNLLKGNLSHLLASQDANSIDHRSHNISKDSIPLRYPNLNVLFLQNNLLSGHIPSNMGDLMPNLFELELSENHLNGTIPSISTIKMSHLRVLSLSNNQLSGELLDYWDTLEALTILDLANNNLYGKIPKTIGLLTSLNVLVLSNNHFHGEIPKSLQNCSLLKKIDLGGNRLYGSFPSWIGRVVSNFSLINLRFNLLTGTIPRQWCNLPFLRILDLSNNNLLGEVPSCLYNWTTFIDEYHPQSSGDYKVNNTIYMSSYVGKTTLVLKEFEYDTTLDYIMMVDLSRNNLSGEIPKEITKLVNLINLNLSNNNLVGTIPKYIGAMHQLETLDLSCNHLFEKIPTSLASLNFLEKLNLSFNNLTGSIPTSNQLRTLDDPSIYKGNPFLCGLPLQTKCNGNENPKNFPISTSEEDVEENDSEMFGIYMGMAIGFPIGLNILFFTIFTSKSRRIWYFRFIHHVSYIILDKIDSFAIHIRRSTRWRRS